MKRIIFYSVLVAGLVAALFLLDSKGQAFFAVVGILGGLAVPVFDVFTRDSDRLRMLLYSARRGRTRLSVAYLFRVESEGEYLLVESSRWSQYQPVGGVYKFYESARSTLESLGYEPDTLIKSDEASRNDLRLSVPSWRLSAFAHWFESGRNREIGGWREFHDELIAPGILPAGIFRTVDYRWVRRRYSELRRPAEAGLREILIADIFVLAPTPEQAAALKDLRTKNVPGVAWANAGLIRSHGAVPGRDLEFKISDHSEWIL